MSNEIDICEINLEKGSLGQTALQHILEFVNFSLVCPHRLERVEKLTVCMQVGVMHVSGECMRMDSVHIQIKIIAKT